MHKVGHRFLPGRETATFRRFPDHGYLGLALIAVAWPASWLKFDFIGEYAFFPLWLGYILSVDAIVLRRTGSSILTRNLPALLAMFLFSIPLWWGFEGINHFTQNWHYLGGEAYSTYQYVLVASWHFTIVIPAVFETAELVGSYRLLRAFSPGPIVTASTRFKVVAVAAGLITLVAVVVWPEHAFPLTWIGVLLILDPINDLFGRPSLLGWLRRGDWSPLVCLGVGALICGWFWEMWNYFAYPKWYYTIPFFDVGRVFEMPLLGYLGYIPFGLEVFVVYHFLGGFAGLVSSRLSNRLSAEPRLPSAAAGNAQHASA